MQLKMPECPKCHSVLPEGTEYCPNDGEPLSNVGLELGVAATAYGPADVRDTSPNSGDDDASEEPTASPKEKSVPPEKLIGKLIGGIYEVIDLLGVGGMGEVYRVKHRNLKKEFALKVLGPIAKEHPDAVERFRQEAIAASHIEHDNIVDIITLDSTVDGNLYIVMELLKGESLADVIQRDAPMDTERALSAVYQICRALHAAHEAGIIHRDLKPENVYLTPKGDAEFIKILDFGISKIHDAEHEKVRITKTGHVLGTPLYMSPEQAKGEPNLDRRVDIYSLAVILFEMLEGKPPFEGENYFQLIWKHSNESAPPMEGPAPEALKEIVLKALAKERDERYNDMLELEEAIMAAVPSIQPPAFLLDFRPTAHSDIDRMSTLQVVPNQRRRWALGAGLVAGIFAILAIAFGLPTNDGDNSNAHVGSTPPPGNTDSGAMAVEVGNFTDEPRAGYGDGGDDVRVTKLVTFTVNSRPEGAKVYLDDEVAGQTPLEIEREPTLEEVEIKVVRRGFITTRKRVVLDDDFSLVIPLKRRATSPGPNDGSGPVKTVW